MTIAKKPVQLDFRLGSPDDYDALLAIQRRAYIEKETPLYGENLPPIQETTAALALEAAAGKQILVAEYQGRLVGSLRFALQNDGSVYWGRLSVDTTMQGRGIAQQLVAAVEKRNPQATSFVLDCGEKSEENFYIYSKLGYVKTGEGFQVPGGPYVFVMRKEAT